MRKKVPFGKLLNNLWMRHWDIQGFIHTAVGVAMDHSAISDADIARARENPRFKQVLLAKSLEQLLASLYRMQRSPANLGPAGARDLRKGALMAVQLADLIRSIDDRLAKAG